MPWVGFQKQEHAERPPSLSVFSVSHSFSASTDFLWFFRDAQPMTYPTVPSFTIKPNDPHREHMLPFNDEKLLKAEKDKNLKDKLALCKCTEKQVPDNRGNDTDSHHFCFFGNLHLVWSGIIEITTLRTLLMIFVFSWTWKLMKLI